MRDDLDGSALWDAAEAAIEMFILSEKHHVPQLRTDAIDRLV
jgi:hypothetical protein